MKKDSFVLDTKSPTFEELVVDLAELLVASPEKQAAEQFCLTWATLGGHSYEDILHHARKQAWRQRNIFTLADLLADKRPVPPDVVQGFVPGESVVVLAGKEGVGKSYLLLELAVTLAGDKPWQGLAVHQGGVLLVDKENRPVRLRERFKKLAAKANLPITIVTDMEFDLDADKFVQELSGLAIDAEARLIILDSLSDFLGDTDENSNSQMGAAAGRLRQVSEATGASVIVIHHVAKSTSGTAQQTARGASALMGGVDVVCQIRRSDNSGILQIMQDKNRMGSPVRFNTRMIFTDGSLRFERIGEVEHGLEPVQLDATDSAITSELKGGEWHWSNEVKVAVEAAANVTSKTVFNHIDKLTAAGIVSVRPTDRQPRQRFEIRLMDQSQ